MWRWFQVCLPKSLCESSSSNMLPSQDEKDDQIIKLNMEVEALKNRCGGYEKIIKDLESRCDTHERTLEMLRQQVVRFHDSQGTLSTMYHEKEYELAP
jgi:hypothetical protein